MFIEKNDKRKSVELKYIRCANSFSKISKRYFGIATLFFDLLILDASIFKNITKKLSFKAKEIDKRKLVMLKLPMFERKTFHKSTTIRRFF